MKIGDNSVVYFNYTLTNDAGEVLDSSDGGEPLAYLHGNGGIIPGLENAMSDHQAGDSFDVSIKPEDGYGERHEELVQKVPRSAFGGVDELEPGMSFQAQTPQGPHLIHVLEVGDDEVTVDGNHPLAGETLHFHIDVEKVRDASKEELDHGHVHDHGHAH